MNQKLNWVEKKASPTLAKWNYRNIIFSEKIFRLRMSTQQLFSYPVTELLGVTRVGFVLIHSQKAKPKGKIIRVRYIQVISKTGKYNEEHNW